MKKIRLNEEVKTDKAKNISQDHAYYPDEICEDSRSWEMFLASLMERDDNRVNHVLHFVL